MARSSFLLAIFAVFFLVISVQASIDEKLLSDILTGNKCGSNIRVFNGLFPNNTSPIVAQVIHGRRGYPVITRTDGPVNYGASSDYIKVFPGQVTVKVSFAGNRSEIIKFSFVAKDNNAYSCAVVSYESVVVHNDVSVTVIPYQDRSPWRVRNATNGAVLATARVSVAQDDVIPPSAGEFKTRFYQNSLYQANFIDFTLTKGSFKTQSVYFDQGHSAAVSAIPGDYTTINRPITPSSQVSVTVNGANVTTNVISPLTLSGLGLANINYAVHFYGNAPGVRVSNPATLSYTPFFSAIDRYGCVHTGITNTNSLPLTLAKYAYVDNTIGFNLTSIV